MGTIRPGAGIKSAKGGPRRNHRDDGGCNDLQPSEVEPVHVLVKLLSGWFFIRLRRINDPPGGEEFLRDIVPLAIRCKPGYCAKCKKPPPKVALTGTTELLGLRLNLSEN